jgi:hypothetical protein
MKKFYIYKNDQQQGPFSLEDLKDLIVTRDTMIWFEGADKWLKAYEIDDLKEILKSVPSPPPIQNNPFLIPPPYVVTKPLEVKKTNNYEISVKKKSTLLTIGIAILLVCGFGSFFIYTYLNQKKSQIELQIEEQRKVLEKENAKLQEKKEIKDSSLLRIGKHQIALQWISSDENPPGSVFITKLSENKYKIEGGQKSTVNSDYLIIKGILTPINTNELIFEGTLIYQVEFNNSGLPCDKSGKQIFKSTLNRKYWRMQEKTNCDGIVVDYIDIFF